jgi:hypothetical protein
MRRNLGLAIALTLALSVGSAPVAQETPPAPTPAPTPAPSPTPAPIAGPAAPVVDQIKIIVDNKAKSDGEIRFAFTPAGGTTKEIRVTVAKGMKKGDICRDIAKELKVVVGESYKVDQYDDDKVKIEGKNGAKFSLTVAGQTVSGISVEIK